MTRTTVAAAGLSVLAACGSGGPANPDGASSDARPADASPDAAPCGGSPGGEITVDTVLAGVTVVFHDASGCVLGRTRSNAFGIAHGTVTADGMITTLVQDQLFTVTRVQPGDTIRTSYRRVEPWSPIETLTVDFVPEADAYAELFSTGCGSTLGPLIAPATFGTNRCVQSDNALSLLALEFTSTGVSWAAIEDFVLDPSGETALTLPAWRTDLATTDVQFQNLSAEVGWVYVKTMPVEDGIVFGVCDDAYFCRVQALRDASTMTLSPSRLPDFGDGLELEAILSYDIDPSVPQTTRFLYRDMAPAATLTLDANVDFLPAIVATGWNADVTDPELTWSAPGPGATADAVIMSLSGAIGVDRYISWSVAVPPEVTQQRLPDLPDDLRPPLAVDLLTYVATFERSDIAGYAEGRTRLFDLQEIQSYQGGWPLHVAAPGFEARSTYLNGVAP